jgi:hypothetical protein
MRFPYTGPFRVPKTNPYVLLRNDQEILMGPAVEMWVFGQWLNADVPPDLDRLRDRIREMIQVSRGCSFCPGPGLKGNRS